MKKIFPVLLFVILSLSVKAQDTKIQVNAKPTEQKEIAADNKLKKTIQQKQLSAPPERIAEPSSMQVNTRKDVKKKKSKCCVRKTAKA